MDCKKYHGKPIKCHSIPGCGYKASNVQGKLGMCYNASKHKSIEKTRDKSRKHQKLESYFDKDAGDRFLRSFRRHKSYNFPSKSSTSTLSNDSQINSKHFDIDNCVYDILENRLDEEHRTDNSFKGLENFHRYYQELGHESYIAKFMGTQYLPVFIIEDIQDEIDEECKSVSSLNKQSSETLTSTLSDDSVPDSTTLSDDSVISSKHFDIDDCVYDLLENRLEEEYRTDNSFRGLENFHSYYHELGYEAYIARFMGTKYLPGDIIDEIQDEIDEECRS